MRENKPHIKRGTSIYIDGELLVTLDKDTERPFRGGHALQLAKDLGLDYMRWLPIGTVIETKASNYYGLTIGAKRILKPRRLFLALETAARIQKRESDHLDIWRQVSLKEYEEHAREEHDHDDRRPTR